MLIMAIAIPSWHIFIPVCDHLDLDLRGRKMSEEAASLLWVRVRRGMRREFRKLWRKRERGHLAEESQVTTLSSTISRSGDRVVWPVRVLDGFKGALLVHSDTSRRPAPAA